MIQVACAVVGALVVAVGLALVHPGLAVAWAGALLFSFGIFKG